jgi:hypothetical protein
LALSAFRLAGAIMSRRPKTSSMVGLVVHAVCSR